MNMLRILKAKYFIFLKVKYDSQEILSLIDSDNDLKMEQTSFYDNMLLGFLHNFHDVFDLK